MTKEKKILNVDNVISGYGEIEILHGVSIEVYEKEIVTIIGPNGCGKSTTIGMMLGLIKPSSGSVIINGQNIEHNRTGLLEKMNFISPYIELPKKLTVRQNLIVYGKL